MAPVWGPSVFLGPNGTSLVMDSTSSSPAGLTDESRRAGSGVSRRIPGPEPGSGEPGGDRGVLLHVGTPPGACQHARGGEGQPVEEASDLLTGTSGAL